MTELTLETEAEEFFRVPLGESATKGRGPSPQLCWRSPRSSACIWATRCWGWGRNSAATVIAPRDEVVPGREELEKEKGEKERNYVLADVLNPLRGTYRGLAPPGVRGRGVGGQKLGKQGGSQ